MTIRTEISGPPAEQLSDLWFLERIAERARTEPNRFAFAVDHADPDKREEYSYADVMDRSGCIGAALTASGVGPGDRVGIQMDNSPQWVFIILAVLRMGGIGVPLSVVLPASCCRLILSFPPIC